MPAGVLHWCQTETPIRSTRGPRHPLDRHEVQSSLIRCRCPVWVEVMCATVPVGRCLSVDWVRRAVHNCTFMLFDVSMLHICSWIHAQCWLSTLWDGWKVSSCQSCLVCCYCNVTQVISYKLYPVKCGCCSTYTVRQWICDWRSSLIISCYLVVLDQWPVWIDVGSWLLYEDVMKRPLSRFWRNF